MMAEWLMYLAVLGLVVLTAVTRAFFFLSERPLTLPDAVVRGLKYAPLAGGARRGGVGLVAQGHAEHHRGGHGHFPGAQAGGGLVSPCGEWVSYNRRVLS